MRVLQLIDSLDAGGAERVAVNIANALSLKENFKSYLCNTRKEGVLKNSLDNNVEYLFLNKKHTLDVSAIKRLHQFVRNNDIRIIHAHSTSFFLATIIKISLPDLVLIWHEHYGNREKTSKASKLVLKGCSYFFSCIIAVNKSLKKRSESKLFPKDVYLVPNYPVINSELKQTNLYGNNGKRIICLANFRPDKDHLNLLTAFALLLKLHKNWTLHLVGKFVKDEYCNAINNFIKQNYLENSIFIYGVRNDISNILNQCEIGILSSKSEGLPMALLEYGLAKLSVIATNVGDCNKVVSNLDEGILVEPENNKALFKALLKLIDHVDLRKRMAENLHNKVVASFSESNTVVVLIKIYGQYKK
tara:strand:+ start:3515 stop:4594 length:1080 start_codon:yes stop_codon:yes gene_type:complete